MSDVDDVQKAHSAFFGSVLGAAENMPASLTRHHDVYPTIDPGMHFESQKYDGKVVCVTGGSRGIGLATAQHYAQAGASVTIVARKADELINARALIVGAAEGARVLTVCADVTVPSEAENAIKQTIEHFGRLDILVANAGAGTSFTIPIGEMDPLAWFESFQVNVLGVFSFIRYAIAHLQKTEGYIVAISSGMAQLRYPNMSAYGISKLAVNRLIEYVDLEYPTIKSFALHPGTIRTEINAAAPHMPTPDSTALAAATILHVTSGKLDWLRGRYVAANWDLEELERDYKEKIIQQKSLVTKLALPI